MSGTVYAGTDRQADAVRLHRLMTGFLASKALFSALELGVFDALEEGPCTPEELGARLGLQDRPARVLLFAMEGEGLVRREAGRYANNPIASTFLVRGSAEYMGALAGHQNSHFGKFVRLTESLRDNQPVRAGENYSAAFGADQHWARRMSQVTNASAVLMADNLAAKAALDGHRHLVDLGCGSCVYSMALARANPGLRITAVDSPAVSEVANEFVAAAGMQDRILIRPGNIFEDRFEDCDVALLCNVIQGWDRERARQLVEHIHDWLPAGGEFLIHSHVPERATVPFPYLFGLILLVNNTQGGENHGEDITCQWLQEAGFHDIRVAEVSPISALIRATK